VASAEGCGEEMCCFGSGRVISWFAGESRCPSAVTVGILLVATKKTYSRVEDPEESNATAAARRRNPLISIISGTS
jgi:hypothetical protein